jgi:hypothetical protein
MAPAEGVRTDSHGRAGQRRRVRPQQRPIRDGRQQHTPSQARSASHQLQSDKRTLAHTGTPQRRRPKRLAVAVIPRSVTHTPNAARF